MSSLDPDQLQCTVTTLREKLLALRQPTGRWVGCLSSSALSTATAAFALAQVDRARHRALIDRGLAWLCAHQNADGGWGDTVGSPSNLSTTLLCYSALAIPEVPPLCNEALAKTESWLCQTVGTLEPQALARAVDRAYGRDRTFSVPILTMCALAGRLGDADAWRSIRPLPFELAVLPRRVFKWLRLPVVSYALPALVAMGQVRFAHRKPRNPLTLLARSAASRRSLRVLETLQPDNGGFLEAAPLTSFVTMSLASCGHRHHPVVRKGVEFLVASMRDDGSWPIDTDLATWVTTLSIRALAASAEDGSLSESLREQLTDWLLACQHRCVHPYTQATPGGWAWSDLPGAVPDADDTAGALLALHDLQASGKGVSEAVTAGIDWLLGLQNRDGGIPTFCRGWTKLPFDKSAPDITAHMVGATGVWLDTLCEPLRQRAQQAMLRALTFLGESQNADGSWLPLWFGNQDVAGKANPVYGTSRALTHLARVPDAYRDRTTSMCDMARQWLLGAQNSDGGWGGAPKVVSSIEETGLAVEALANGLLPGQVRGDDAVLTAISRGASWLVAHTDQGRSVAPTPIGLYFAQLWYHEELYPIVFALSALAKAQRLFPSH